MRIQEAALTEAARRRQPDRNPICCRHLKLVELGTPVDEPGRNWSLIVERIHRTRLYGFTGQNLPGRLTDLRGTNSQARTSRPRTSSPVAPMLAGIGESAKPHDQAPNRLLAMLGRIAKFGQFGAVRLQSGLQPRPGSPGRSGVRPRCSRQSGSILSSIASNPSVPRSGGAGVVRPRVGLERRDARSRLELVEQLDAAIIMRDDLDLGSHEAGEPNGGADRFGGLGRDQGRRTEMGTENGRPAHHESHDPCRWRKRESG